MAQALRSPALDPKTVQARRGSSYPAPFRAAVEDREKRPLGDAVGLTQFGVNLVAAAARLLVRRSATGTPTRTSSSTCWTAS